MNANKRLAAARANLTPTERNRDRKRAAKALGRPLRHPELVHHFSRTQLVICPDAAYHHLLHILEDEGGWDLIAVEAELAAINNRYDAEYTKSR